MQELRQINITVNSVEYTANEPMTVLAFLKEIGINIPSVCFINKHTDGGSCKVCSVEINGIITQSCNTQIKDGMEIVTDSENIKQARTWAISFLLSRHPADCYACHKMGACRLAEVFHDEGQVFPQHLKPKSIFSKKEFINKHISIDYSKCIYCGLCDDTSKVTKETVSVCPTGALESY